MNYVTNVTLFHLFSLRFPNILILNSPKSLLLYSEKLSIFHFKDFYPKTIVSRSKKEIISFVEIHKRVVLKPLYSFGGNGIFLLQHCDPNLEPIIELSLQDAPLMIQEFIPDIEKGGDLRLFFIKGELVNCFSRHPKPGDFKSNVRIGGSKNISKMPQEMDLIKNLSDFFLKNDIFLAAVDMIGPFITEINITSPGCLNVASELYNFDLPAFFWEKTEIFCELY
jgi:glutathione synthase